MAWQLKQFQREKKIVVPLVKSGQLSAFVNKALLGHSHVHSFRYCLWLGDSGSGYRHSCLESLVYWLYGHMTIFSEILIHLCFNTSFPRNSSSCQQYCELETSDAKKPSNDHQMAMVFSRAGPCSTSNWVLFKLPNNLYSLLLRCLVGWQADSYVGVSSAMGGHSILLVPNTPEVAAGLGTPFCSCPRYPAACPQVLPQQLSISLACPVTLLSDWSSITAPRVFWLLVGAWFKWEPPGPNSLSEAETLSRESARFRRLQQSALRVGGF